MFLTYVQSKCGECIQCECLFVHIIMQALKHGIRRLHCQPSMHIILQACLKVTSLAQAPFDLSNEKTDRDYFSEADADCLNEAIHHGH